MELTLVGQLMNSCKHFTGLGDKACKIGIEYAAVRDRLSRTISCMKMSGSFMSHNDICSRQEFMTHDEAVVDVEAIREQGKKIDAMICPTCDGPLEDHTRKSGRYKGHGKITCSVCEKAVVII